MEKQTTSRHKSLVINILNINHKSNTKNDSDSSKKRRTNRRIQRAKNHGCHPQSHDAYRQGRRHDPRGANSRPRGLSWQEPDERGGHPGCHRDGAHEERSQGRGTEVHRLPQPAQHRSQGEDTRRVHEHRQR